MPHTEHVVINIEGNPEQPLLGQHIHSSTPLWQNGNPFIRIPARIVRGTFQRRYIILRFFYNILPISLVFLGTSLAVVAATSQEPRILEMFASGLSFVLFAIIHRLSRERTSEIPG